jgi:hypothetical protein
LQAEKAFLKIVKENFLLLTDGSSKQKTSFKENDQRRKFQVFFLIGESKKNIEVVVSLKIQNQVKIFFVHLLIITPRILVRCHIGDPVTIQCDDAQSGLRLFFNLELMVCPKR